MVRMAVLELGSSHISTEQLPGHRIVRWWPFPAAADLDQGKSDRWLTRPNCSGSICTVSVINGSFKSVLMFSHRLLVLRTVQRSSSGPVDPLSSLQALSIERARQSKRIEHEWLAMTSCSSCYNFSCRSVLENIRKNFKLLIVGLFNDTSCYMTDTRQQIKKQQRTYRTPCRDWSAAGFTRGSQYSVYVSQ